MSKREYSQRETVCVNHSFKVGQRYKIRHGTLYRVMRVDTIKDGYARFVDVHDSRVRCSGEIYSVSLPSCQSCNIDGCDMVFSYDVMV